MSPLVAAPLPLAADVSRPIIWSIVLIGVILVAFFGINFYRKWMTSDETTSGPGFTLADLRKLHKEGQMTDAEFEKAKANLLGSLKAAADKPVLGPRNPRRNADADTDET